MERPFTSRYVSADDRRGVLFALTWNVGEKLGTPETLLYLVEVLAARYEARHRPALLWGMPLEEGVVAVQEVVPWGSQVPATLDREVAARSRGSWRVAARAGRQVLLVSRGLAAGTPLVASKRCLGVHIGCPGRWAGLSLVGVHGRSHLDGAADPPVRMSKGLGLATEIRSITRGGPALIMGDFNDTPDASVMFNALRASGDQTWVRRHACDVHRGPGLYNPTWGLFGSASGDAPGGTFFFDKEARDRGRCWSILDQILVSVELVGIPGTVRLRPDYSGHRLEPDGEPSPGARSDHVPVELCLEGMERILI